MSSVLTGLFTIIGISICGIAVIGGIWQYPYLIVVPVAAYYMLRALYRRANAQFQHDVAALARVGGGQRSAHVAGAGGGNGGMRQDAAWS